jgi:hypothetical protein
MKRRDGKTSPSADPEIPGKNGNRECVENVILCVARAEKLVSEIGKSLLGGAPSDYKRSDKAEGFLPDED